MESQIVDWKEMAYYAKAAWPESDTTMDPDDEEEQCLNISRTRISIGWGADDPTNVTIYREVWYGGYDDPPVPDVVAVETLAAATDPAYVVRAAWMIDQADLIDNRLADAGFARFVEQTAALDAAGGARHERRSDGVSQL